jgi:hypothetical protein
VAAGPIWTARAGNLYAFDLDSPAYMRTSVIEGDVVSVKTINWIDVLKTMIPTNQGPLCRLNLFMNTWLLSAAFTRRPGMRNWRLR